VCLASNGQISEHHRSEFPTRVGCKNKHVVTVMPLIESMAELP
jgi:hypothetical protein